ncbi:MAG: PPC domain-containing protein [Anaerolineae bacterium]
MMRWVCLSFIILCFVPLTITAQDDAVPDADDAETIDPGEIIGGRVDASNPRVIYSIDGSRGAILRVRLTVTQGNLDPVLLMFDPSNNLLVNRDDADGSRDIDLTITLQENGSYLLIVGRFGYALGTTTGEYELDVERVGVSSAEGSTLQYGVPITNTITNTQPRLFFTFEASEGDIINLSMVRSSGSLDPYVQLLDPNRFLVAENDDSNGGQNSRIQAFVVDTTGTYIVVATRYGQAAGNSAGSFVLTVEEASNSGLGNSRFSPAGIAFNQTRTGELTDALYERFYVFEGRRDQIISINMTRTEFAGQLDAYLVLANAQFQTLIEDDDSGEGSSAQISNYRLPENGLYYIIATRFQRAEGETFGEYTLTLTDEGSAFTGVPEGIPRLLYGTSLEDTLTNDDAESLFAFWGTAGERVIITMDRTEGNLDSVLELLDAQQLRMFRDDDGGFENNARLDVTLDYTGVYYIRALRFDGTTGNDTTGTYRLNLTRIVNNN